MELSRYLLIELSHSLNIGELYKRSPPTSSEGKYDLLSVSMVCWILSWLSTETSLGIVCRARYYMPQQQCQFRYGGKMTFIFICLAIPFPLVVLVASPENNWKMGARHWHVPPAVDVVHWGSLLHFIATPLLQFRFLHSIKKIFYNLEISGKNNGCS